MDIEHPMNRKRLLERVHKFWIASVFEGHWLHDALFLHPDLHELPSALDNPWASNIQETRLPKRPLPQDTRVIDVYDNANGALLILGEPGMGKTTLLLELMRSLLERAKQDEEQPIPLLFDLACWEEQLPLSEWFIQECKNKYSISSAAARKLFTMQQILPLVDSFDKVLPDVLLRCVNTINAYMEDNPLPIVLCSRSAEYLRLQTRLKMHYAVAIQPLTELQVDRYLLSVGKYEELHDILSRDESLHMLATTPLFLSILTQVDYKLFTRNPRDMNREVLQQTVFAAYVESVLTRGKDDTSYPSSSTVQWLAWMAQQGEKHNLIIFSLGDIQPSWLTEKWSVLVYYMYNSLIGALLSGAILGLVGAAMGGRVLGLVTAVMGALVGGIGFAFAARKIRPVRKMHPILVKRQIGSLLSLLVLWLLVLFIHQAGNLSGSITTIILLLSLPLLLIGELLREHPVTLRDSLFVDHNLRQSAQNGICVGLLVGACLSLLVLFFQVLGLLKADLISFLFVTVLLGAFSGLSFGGLAMLQLKWLHWLLWRSGATPKNWLEFLDYATTHLVLSKVGDSYMFRYPQLQDYFATLPEA